jgi:hypothetical protein
MTDSNPPTSTETPVPFVLSSETPGASASTLVTVSRAIRRETTLTAYTDWKPFQLSNCQFHGLAAPHLTMHHARCCQFQNSVLPNFVGRGGDFRDTDWTAAQLQRADFRGADLRMCQFESADLNGANLVGADLRSANFRDADLRGANLTGCMMHHASMKGAKIDCGTRLPSPTMILSMQWGPLESELCAKMMRFDAASHPGGVEAFEKWNDDGDGACPYAHDCKVERAAFFHEDSSNWTAGMSAPEPWQLAAELMLAHCSTPSNVSTVQELSGLFYTAPDAMKEWNVSFTRTVTSTRTESASTTVEATSEEAAQEAAETERDDGCLDWEDNGDNEDTDWDDEDTTVEEA